MVVSPVAGQDLLFRRLGGDGFSKLLDEAEVRGLSTMAMAGKSFLDISDKY